MTGSTKKTPSTLMVVLAFATVYIVWGSTYLAIQKAVHGFPPLLMGALRFVAAGLILLTWCLIRGEKVFVKKNIRDSSVSGVLMLFVGNGIVIWVEQFMPTAMVAITLSSAPLWFILLDRSKWSENFRSRSTIAGLVIGFAGVILLFSENFMAASSSGGSSASLGGLALLCVGSIAWSAGSLYSKYNSHGGSASVSTAWQMLAAGVAFIPLSVIRGEAIGFNWSTIPTESWLAICYLVTFGSILGFSAYVWLLQVRPATQVSTYAYVNPVVAVLLGILFANESISWIQVTGLAIILGSVLLINMAKYRAGKKMDLAHKDANEVRTSESINPVTVRATSNKTVNKVRS